MSEPVVQDLGGRAVSAHRSPRSIQLVRETAKEHREPGDVRQPGRARRRLGRVRRVARGVHALLPGEDRPAGCILLGDSGSGGCESGDLNMAYITKSNGNTTRIPE